MTINCKTTLYKINSWTLFSLPTSDSIKLPSRGMVMVKGTINGFRIVTVLEPDGKGSHWCRITKQMRDEFEVACGDTISLEIEPSNEWMEPEVPEDLKSALARIPLARKLWMDCTPMARWDWIRWIRGTKSVATRKNRIEKACSMLEAGKRRPCCFNRNLCSEPYVSKGGVLLAPE